MSRRDGIASIVLILAGLLATAWTVLSVRRALSWVPPRGGIGAVSGGLFLALLSFLVLVLLNWSVAKAARRHGRLAARFRRAHLWLMVVSAVWAVVSDVWFMRAYAAGADAFFRAIKVINVVSAPFLPLQAFFAASVLAFIIGHPGGAERRG